jgi:hypothetical protein
MRVFVLTTGRSASTTFARACAHIRNYTVGHESRWGLLGEMRLDYADQHIEVDNRLVWLLGRLDNRFGDQAFYVHLVRDRDAVAQSYCRRRLGRGSIMRAYSHGILYRSQTTIEDCLDYCDTVNANIKLFLKDKTRVLNFDVSQAGDDFAIFWDRIGASGDLSAALAEWRLSYNDRRDELKNRNAVGHSLRKLKRIMVQLPEFLKNA